MAFRDRSRHRSLGVGVANSLAGLGQQLKGYGVDDRCVDEVGDFTEDNPLLVTHLPNFGWLSSGKVAGWWDTVDYPGGSWHDYPSDPAYPSNDALFAKGLALSNPNTPDVDIPLFAIELKDLPQMLKEKGTTVARRLGKAAGKSQPLADLPTAIARNYVEYSFAIAPLVSDLRKMLEFQKRVDRKINILKNLDRPGGTSQSGTVYSSQIPGSESAWLPATTLYQEQRYLKYTPRVNRRSWVSTRWKSKVPLPQTAQDQRSLAIRLAYGLDISFSTMWQAMPWSWLFDWFSNAGDFYDINRNTVPVTHSRTCLMKSVDVSRQLTGTTWDNPANTLSVKFPAYSQSRRERVLLGNGLPNFEFGVPFINGHQMAILSSLSVLKIAPK